MIESRAADPHIHRKCLRIARKCVWIIQACLRDEERIDAVREFYKVCRDELDKPPPLEDL